MDGLLEVVGATITILSKNELDLQTPDATPSTLPGPSEIEVFNPYTSKAEMIRSDDPKFYDAGGFKTRRYQGSSKPKDIPSFVWQSMSVKQRRLAIAEEQKKLARVTDMAALPKKAAASKRSRHSETWALVRVSEGNAGSSSSQDAEEVPKMPVCGYSVQRHRDKLIKVGRLQGEKAINTLVARPVNRKEIRSNPKAQASLDVEWVKLEKKDAWLYDTVQEWKDVASKAKKQGKKVHIGKVFEICVAHWTRTSQI